MMVWDGLAAVPISYLWFFLNFAFHRVKFKRAVRNSTVIAYLRDKLVSMLYAYDVIEGPLALKLNY